MVYKVKMPEAWARVQWCKQQFGGIDGVESADTSILITKKIIYFTV